MEKNAKLRPFLVAKIIFERTDEDNYLTIAQILDILKKEYGIESYRKTIQADIDTLIAFGFDNPADSVLSFLSFLSHGYH